MNCCYADGTWLTARLGHSIEPFRCEYAAASIVEFDLPRLVSLSILDGPFMCLLPFGGGGQYLLYHVNHGVIAEQETDFLDRRWLDPETSPFAKVNRQDWFAAQLASCCEFVPALHHCRLKSFVQRPRRVLAKSDDTDARPSIVTEHEPGYLSVFSGKVDHSVWVADDIASRLGRNRELNFALPRQPGAAGNDRGRLRALSMRESEATSEAPKARSRQGEARTAAE